MMSVSIEALKLSREWAVDQMHSHGYDRTQVEAQLVAHFVGQALAAPTMEQRTEAEVSSHSFAAAGFKDFERGGRA